MPSGRGPCSFARPARSELFEAGEHLGAIGAAGALLREERAVVSRRLRHSPLPVEGYGQIAVGLKMARDDAQGATEAFDALAGVARPDQDHAQAIPGLGVGGIQVDGLAEGNRGLVHLATLSGFGALAYQARHP